GGGLVRHVRLERLRAPARRLDLVDHRGGGGSVGPVVDRDGPAVGAQPARDRGAEAAGGAGDQRDSCLLMHSVTLSRGMGWPSRGSWSAPCAGNRGRGLMVTPKSHTNVARTPVQAASLLVGLLFLLVGLLGFVPGITTNFDAMAFAGHH